MAPYAVRIRTATGWQDIALTGPPGPTGQNGGQFNYNFIDGSQNFPGPDGQCAVDNSDPVAATSLWIGQRDADGNDMSAMMSTIQQPQRIIYRSKADPQKWTSYIVRDQMPATQSWGWRIDNIFVAQIGPNGKVPLGPITLIVVPTGPSGQVNVYEQPDAPTGIPVGTVWIDTDATIPAGTVVPRRTGFSWAIKGSIIAETQPSYFVPIAPGQISNLIGVRAKIASGTSIGCQLQQNGSNIGPAVTVTINKATTLFSPAIALVDGDEITLVTSSASGTPTNLSLTAIMEHRA